MAVYQLLCTSCGELFSSPGNQTRLCPKCHPLCFVCGKPVRRATSEKFCSNDCSNHYRRTVGMPEKQHVCQLCGGVFVSRAAVASRCESCRKCLICGTEIANQTAPLKQRCCSQRCAGLLLMKTNPEHMRRIQRLARTPEARRKRGIAISNAKRGIPRYDLRGPKHFNWRGGTTALHHIRTHAMSTIEYKTWRQAVFERDHHTCQDCGTTEGYLQAHHDYCWRDFPELRYVVENGVTLCQKCHVVRHNLG